MSIRKRAVLFMSLVCVAGIEVNGYDIETKRIMPFISTNTACHKCHLPKKAASFKGKTATACSSFCVTCHKELGSHHPVGVRMVRKIPRGLAFNQFKITCHTCHDLNIRRFDNSPWRSESLFDTIFNKKQMYKTYYLTVKNTDGKLCKKCH